MENRLKNLLQVFYYLLFLRNNQGLIVNVWHVNLDSFMAVDPLQLIFELRLNKELKSDLQRLTGFRIVFIEF